MLKSFKKKKRGSHGVTFIHGATCIQVMTFCIEGIGAVLLFLHFKNHYPAMTALYHAVFHSISAFCNAGFSLYVDSFVSLLKRLSIKAPPLYTIEITELVVYYLMH